MRRKEISELVKRRLYAESIGRCMNPRCQKNYSYMVEILLKKPI